MHFKVNHLAVDGDATPGAIIDHNRPVFTWAAEHSDNGKHQTAYRLIVSTEDALKWDSGWIASDCQTAEYAGDQLVTGEKLNWTVQIKDNDGNESSVGISRFVTALMDPWEAPWITTPWDTAGEAKYFRKQICIPKEVKKAFLYVCGIGYQYVTLNGAEIDEAYLQPAISNYAKHCYYVTLDATAHLRVGDNHLDVVVGEGWRRNPGNYLRHVPREVEFFGKPKLTAELRVEYIDGETARFFTDESWLCGRGPVVFNNLFDGEVYDERKQIQYTSPACIVTEPCPAMRAQVIRPVLCNEILSPVVKTKVDNGYVFDFGTNIAGIVEVVIPAEMPEGTEIKIYHVENIGPDGSKDAETIRDAKALDIFICGGEKTERRWKPRFVYHGFRYIYVEGWHDIPDSENFKAISLFTDIKNKSFFRCGSAVVNQIQECIIQTEKNNLHSIATDCPQRDERMGWLNDSTVRFEEMPYNFNMRRLFSKIIDDVVAEQSEDGAVTCTAPFVFGNRPADPVSSSFLIAALENYLHYGSKEDIESHYADFKAWNECLKRNSEEGIVTFSHYGDWAGPADCCVSMENAGSVMTPGILMSTGFHYFNFKLLQKFAEILGYSEEAEWNGKEAERVKKAFLKKWWNDETGVVDKGSAGSQAFALWLGILPEDKRELAARVMHEAVVEAGCRITTGNLNTRYVMDMLAKYGYIDTAWELMIREEYPSWGFMLQNGATTVWERFEFKRGSGMNSHDHPMYGSVGYWLYSYIAGICPQEAGWKKFAVRPYLPKKLMYAEASVETPFGMIYLKWQKQAGYTDVLLNVPFGTTADVRLPWGENIVAEPGYHNFHHQEAAE